MAISPLYIPLFNIEEVILDKDSGLPLSGGVVTFYRDSQRVTPKPVYQITGVSPNYMFVSVGNQLTLGNAGDFVDGTGNPFVPYAYPYDADGNTDLYYVTVVSQGGVSQFTRQAVPYIPNSAVNPGDLTSDGNQISNPQFAEILFSPSAASTIPVTGSNTVTAIAPGWDLITTGTGNVVVERLEPTAENVPTNPPYSLRISADAALGATVTLRQRFYNAPSIFRGNFASATFTAAVISGGGSAISMSYAPSVGTATTLIPNTSIPTDGAYHSIAGNASITVQANDPATTGYADVLLTIPTGRNIAITSIQIVGLDFSADIDFDEQTSARQKDHLFHYYENSLVRQAKENILTGWNFGLNPWQFSPTAATTITAQTSYITDQTVLYQETASAIQAGKAAYNLNYGLQLSAINGVDANKFAIIQYIDSKTIAPYWGQYLSCLVRAIYNHTDGALPTPQLKMRLIWRTDAVPTLGASEPITGFDADGDPTFAAGWNEILPQNDIFYTMTNLSTLSPNNQFPAMAFDRFLMPTPTGVSIPLYLGVVVYINKPLNNVAGLVDYVAFDRISLTPNNFALDCCNETYDESLRKCQYYYETSYRTSSAIGTNTEVGINYASNPLGGDYSSTVMYKCTFELVYKTIKNKVPVTTWYAKDGTADRYQLGAWSGSGYPAPGSGSNPINVSTANWTAVSNTEESVLLRPNNTTAIMSFPAVPAGKQGEILYHYTADARLGI